MGKNQSASGLTNVIQYNNNGITFVSASTTLGTLNSSGSLSVTQNITGSNILATGNIVAQTLVVQTVTSSINYSSGSNIFGNQLTNIQQFTGSVRVTGSLSVATTNTELQVGATGVTLGNVLTDVHQVTGSLRVTGSGNHFIQGANVGVGTNDIVSINLAGSLTIRKSYNGDTPNGATTQPYYTNQSNLFLFGRNAGITLISNNSEEAIIAFANNSSPYIGGIRYGTGTNATGGDMVFQTSGSTERMRITSGGNVGIGTADTNLQFYRTLISNNAANTYVGITNGSGADGSRTLKMGLSSAGTFAIIQGTRINVADDVNIILQPDGAKVGINTTTLGTEANLHLGANGTLEGGQLILQRGTTQVSASHLDNYQNRFRVMSGTDTTSTAERFSVDMTNGATTVNGSLLDVTAPSNPITARLTSDGTYNSIIRDYIATSSTTVDITTERTDGGGFHFLVIASSTLIASGANWNKYMWAVQGRGTTGNAVQLANTSAGTASRTAMSVSFPSNGVIRLTLTGGESCQVKVTIIGHGAL